VRKINKPSLTVIGSTPSPTDAEPPRALGRAGAAVWRRIVGGYDITDEGGRELLSQICEASDRLDELQETIKRDGAIVMTRAGPKEHPGLKAEVALRSFIVRTIQRLGLNLEPLRPGPGRPSGER
jgi:phage terminase small subunit